MSDIGQNSLPTERPADLPGLDLGRLSGWLDRTLPAGRSGELTARALTGGRSNLTYLVTDGTDSWVLRRPPVGEVLATAHDVAREHRVLAALADTDVPVPRVFGLCADPAILGAPFYVMEHVVGTTYRDASDLAPLRPTRTRAISESLVDTLALVHSVDVQAVGLDTLGRPQGFLARQVRRWAAQLEASETPAIALARTVHRQLEERVPADNLPGIVHGDYRLDNVLVAPDDRTLAVIDWEMASCGDTITDLALLVVYQRTARIAEGMVVPTASSAPGFLTEQEIVERYQRSSARDLNRFGFYLGLASFKLAGIIAGIHQRYLNGQVTGPGVDKVGAMVEPLLEAGLSTLREDD
ncbi:phosphotransferase family protein [Nocardia sp. NPDC049190]|uniref:phosphotransferase family protein n=1 Tax=Nocardia sp. NPDC049190 TaxID=3155650 RepID=UPI0033DD8577